ncbi:glycosyltransferase involved in cell wall biosynthesis [Parabacteroides sp. PFB2-12]|uniref:glycosyltransferase family 4 protein n=1 Tax=unclassified Parabacteroides TaxID=2649774 RepID=UPI0024742534|nr:MULTISPECIES: glycosyltransferase family 4 protein [unclassified Parabacteroides]MDH6342255.1 glycosyltransferase involved in cell wall biosynthesis [Parabacteroides sp. PM6-13]MDH6390598.1 glycosyltransferase involved in cell wall biosynthesis [Parabacteroides sp. PFB2-12]
MRVLINCYACSPYKGSEPGMGWNFVWGLSQKHELHILTECKFQQDIERFMKDVPEASKFLHFYYIKKKRHKLLRKLWPPSYYWFYRDWQKKAFQKAIELDKELNFDIVHQLNMVGYREPGYLWRMEKPFVWGPIGGFNITPWRMLTSMGFYGALFYAFRNVINLKQMYTMRRVKSAMKRADALIAATQNEAETILRLYKRKSIVIPEVGWQKAELKQFSPHKRETTLKICWSGQHTPGKSLNLLIEALSLVRCKVELHVLGSGRCTEKWKKQSAKIEHIRFFWYGWVERSKSIEIMKTCDLFCITSLSDLTSTVLLEALSYGLPVIALDHCGFSNVLTEQCGIKIPIHTKAQVVSAIAKAIEQIDADEELRQMMSVAAYERAQQYNWDDKIETISGIYNEVAK